jgi:hypothetical protein
LKNAAGAREIVATPRLIGRGVLYAKEMRRENRPERLWPPEDATG